jgi:hypothetical protein
MEQYTNATQNPFPTDRVFNDPEIAASLHKHGVIGNDAPPTTAPTTHAFSLSAWQRANPKGDPNAARSAAQQQGYQVTQ